MKRPTASELEAARQPIASLLSKSAKAQRKLAPGTWQHRMLRANLDALRVALVVIDGAAGGAGRLGRDALPSALAALAAMIGRVEKAQARFVPGTPQHSLQRNRLKALRVAEAASLSVLNRRDE